ncbi:NADH dehydrogenase-like [Tropilaelaps mercedesae]|uniref:NADH dehydrogenase [ubiquinone] 1 beta subcomplex subunit 11, mitochondrial n=1 Tax=Tropilaelaps mercedesae TaxID=418985 RepID=A0A1V9XPQ8_9ACAR|nr:NADH dehydrogenase-like [Tropilaelaps mercedesae]
MSLRHLGAVHHLGRRVLAAQRWAPPTGISMSARWISATQKKPATETAVIPNTVIDNPPRTVEDFAEAATKPRNWISYGYSTENIEDDRDQNALVLFCTLSCGIVFTVFVWSYLPDFKNRDWIHRQAYLELNRREKHGLPLIDKEYIPLERINLPTEEELEGKEVYL